MNKLSPATPTSQSLEQLLQREDVWLGHSRRFIAGAALDTGHETLNLCLVQRGWPLAGLVEVCQPGMQGEWQLFTPALLQVSGLTVLLNPPAAPFSQALIQAGIDLDRLLVVSATDKEHFLACFIELSRAGVGALLAWQPRESLTYTELRKCHLAAQQATGLSVLFRPAAAQQQSSPAALRLYARRVPAGLEITAFKQTGHLQARQSRPVVLPLPDLWQPVLPYPALDQVVPPARPGAPPQRWSGVTPWRSKA